MAENADRKQRGKPFEKGISGNPRGKPKGSRHKITLLAEKLMSDDAEAIVKTVVDAAKSGDLTAARIVLDRIAPARRDNPVNFGLLEIKTAGDAAMAMGSLLNAVASGDLTPGEAGEVAKLVDTFTKALEATEFEMRLRALEERAQR